MKSFSTSFGQQSHFCISTLRLLLLFSLMFYEECFRHENIQHALNYFPSIFCSRYGCDQEIQSNMRDAHRAFDVNVWDVGSETNKNKKEAKGALCASSIILNIEVNEFCFF